MRNSQKAGGDATMVVNNYECCEISPEGKELIRSISSETFANNFPVLIEIAKSVAFERASHLTEEIIDRVSSIENAIRNFQDPDFLFTLQEALKHYARHGGDELGAVVARVVADRASLESEETILKSVLGEACSIAPRLQTSQIEALSFLHVLTKTSYKSVKTLDDLECIYAKGLEALCYGIDTSQNSIFHLEYFGLISVNRLHQKNLGRNIFTSYFDRDGYTFEKFSQDVKKHRAISTFLDWYEKNELMFAEITLVGQAIAVSRIRLDFPTFDYDIWIK